MTDTNTRAFRNFEGFLNARQAQAEDDSVFDIRDFIIENRHLRWNVGFAEANLKKAFSANLDQLFSQLISVEDERFGRERRFLVYGAVVEDENFSHKSALKILPEIKLEDQTVVFEMGFLASAYSWSEALRSRSPNMACLGYVYDDIGHYYMTDYPNRLIRRLNSPRGITALEMERAQQLIARIVERRISKYNSQPVYPLAVTQGYNRRVLVVDQNFSDASTLYGRADATTFERMLQAAIDENPDAEILVKTHPDVAWTKNKERRGFFDHLTDQGRVRILRDAINPFCLFDLVDTVYVGTSGMGLEALLAGKKVVCFGAPFYAGWGLTDDRQTIPHRQRQRTLVEIFHYFYIWYTIYNVPGAETPSQIEDCLDYIEQHRPFILGAQSDTPKVSVIVPVYGVEKYIEQCITSIQRQTLNDFEIITVNDQSRDGSQDIIDRLASVDQRIRSITLPANVGPGFARNEGLKVARGEYILFLDPDDYIPSVTHLEKMVACADADQSDMVRGRKLLEQVENSQSGVVTMRPDKTEEFFDTEFHNRTLENEPRIVHSRHFWNWLYRRSFLADNGIRFLTTYREERAFVLNALLTAQSLSGVNSDGVVYRIREDSAVRREQEMSDVFDQVSNFQSVVDILGRHGAFQSGSKLRFIAQFQVSQFMHYLFFGFAYKTALSKGSATELKDFYLRIADTLRQTGFSATDLVSDPIQLSDQHVKSYAYGLMFEALRSGKYGYIALAKELQPVRQTELMKIVLAEPKDTLEDAFQLALSRYARNGLVLAAPTENPVKDKPRLVLHVGSSKTGSTYIQHFLERNRPALLRQGIWYPEVGLFWQQDRPHKQAGHSSFISAASKNDGKLLAYIEAGLALAKGRIHTIILSSEGFFLNHESFQIADYFADYPKSVIGYFRRQDEWANSQYCEFVGGGAIGKVDCEIGEWLSQDITKQRLRYDLYLDMWSQKIGRANVIVRPYEKEQLHNGDILSDFCEALGLGACLALPKPEAFQRNDFALAGRHIKLMRHFNALPFPSLQHYLRFVDLVTNRLESFGMPSSKPEMMDLDQKQCLIKEYEKCNAYIAETYLGRKDGRLFLSNTASDQQQTSETALSEQELSVFFSAYNKEAGAGRRKSSSSGNRIEEAVIWRRVILYMLMPIVRKLGNAADVTKYQKNPRVFFAELSNPRFRKVGELLYGSGR